MNWDESVLLDRPVEYLTDASQRNEVDFEDASCNLGDIAAWLPKSAETGTLKPGTFKLLIMEVEDSGSPLPFFSKEHLDSTAAALGLLPRTPVIFARLGFYPITISEVESGCIHVTGARGARVTFSLRYNRADGTATGLLLLDNQSAKHYISNIKYMRRYIDSPLLLPMAMYKDESARLMSIVSNTSTTMKEVQADTGLLDRSFLRLPQIQGAEDENHGSFAPNFDEMHKTIVHAHAQLTKASCTLAPEVGAEFHAAKLCLWKLIGINPFSRHEGIELEDLINSFDADVKEAMGARATLLARIDIQLQVLYNMMQQAIAKEARRDNDIMKDLSAQALRDSSQMKSIAVLTMVFLPTTALATIFSMSPFFVSDADGRISASSDFWIFWAVTIPVTALTCLMYFGWIERKEVRDWWFQRKLKRRERMAKAKLAPGPAP